MVKISLTTQGNGKPFPAEPLPTNSIYMNNTTKVRIVYECSTIGLVLLTFLKVMIPSIQTWWQIALVVSFVGLWFSLSYLKRHNYKWGFNYIENHLYIHL